VTATTLAAAPPQSGPLARAAPLLAVLGVAVMIAAEMIPGSWHSNEVNYFDLAHRFVAPEAYGPDHSVFDSSQARAVSFALLGGTIERLGFDGAKTLFALLLWAAYAAGLAALARRMGLGVAGAMAGLALFLAAGPSLFGREWILGAVEAKTFAYAAVFAGLALALGGRWIAALAAMALATWFHFLVGAFWALSVLILHALWRPEGAGAGAGARTGVGGAWHGEAGRLARLAGLYVLMVLPVLGVLVWEQIAFRPDLAGLDRTLAEIYAEFRNPHHVAPFAEGAGTFVREWLPGLVQHAALAALFWLLPEPGRPGGPAAAGMGAAAAVVAGPPVNRWVAALNLLMALTVVLAFLDRHTHAFAPFYAFRPSSLVLLLSCLAAARLAFAALPALARPLPAALVAALAVSTVLADLSREARAALRLGGSDRLAAMQTPAQRALVDWIREETEPGTAVLLEPVRPGVTLMEGDPATASFERLTGRPFLVNFKFVPVAAPDMAEWYRRLQQREAFRAGDCAALGRLGADLVVFVTDAPGGEAGGGAGAGGPVGGPAGDRAAELEAALAAEAGAACVRPLHRIGPYLLAELLERAS
jgi:hypothetical protein